ncbi:ChaN family lipoprotein [Pseudomonas sp.]|uniref:ChaN family lipoprotein n=1 Tax=Pseudomonas sp. TaxID=306 RepID=UPI0028ADD153|nr:ChaN family lipoprotein [Pseudomonas sp.]
MRLLLPLVLLLLVACQSVPPDTVGSEQPPPGRIVDLRNGRTLSAGQLVDSLSRADRVLVGERHDNPVHHQVQRWLLEALAQRRKPGSLLLEMLNPDQQRRVSGVQASAVRGTWPDELPGALAWQPGWPWSLYGPLVRYALAQPYPLRAANLDRAEISAIYRQVPSVTGAAAEPAVQAAIREQIRVSHCNMLPEAEVPAMLAVQQQRDRRMADRMDAAPKPAVLFAGAFHVRRDLGVPLHLAAAGAATRVLMLAEQGEVVTAAQADYAWFTSAPRREEGCAAFRRADR